MNDEWTVQSMIMYLFLFFIQFGFQFGQQNVKKGAALLPGTFFDQLSFKTGHFFHRRFQLVLADC